MFLHPIIDQCIARASIKSHHLGSISMGQMAIGNSTNVQSENGANVAEGHIIEILHERCAGAAQRMLHGAEVGDDMGLAGFRDNRRFADLQAAGEGAVQPARRNNTTLSSGSINNST